MPVTVAKPAPEFRDDYSSTCVHCHRGIKKVPGGWGPVWVHWDGYVVCAPKEAEELDRQLRFNPPKDTPRPS